MKEFISIVVWNLNYQTGEKLVRMVATLDQAKAVEYQNLYCETNQACMEVSNKLNLLGKKVDDGRYQLFNQERTTIMTKKGEKQKMPWILI